jgi:hypothetical protein
VTKVQHYAEYSNGVYSDLIVEENNTYNRNTVGYVESRDKTIVWIDEDEVASEPKLTVKNYNTIESLDE